MSMSFLSQVLIKSCIIIKITIIGTRTTMIELYDTIATIHCYSACYLYQSMTQVRPPTCVQSTNVARAQKRLPGTDLRHI